MLKVMTILGTRPELIRLSRVIARLDEAVEHVLVHTGQNYDFGLNEVFFADLGIRAPDHLLHCDSTSLGRFLGETLIRTEAVLRAEQPDAVLILGDTNSSIAAVMARRMRIPVYHMEAGNRCFDDRVPEETNRRLVDHVADYNLVYTEHARRNLLSEGIHPARILLTGSPMREVLTHYRPQIDASSVLDRLGLASGRYFLVSAHREENVDSPERLGLLLDCLRAVQAKWKLPVWVSTHPRTRKRLGALTGWSEPDGMVFHEPFGFSDFNRLQLGAACVLSDSGTIAEESAMLGFPAITIRDFIERPEALDSGGIITTGLDVDDVHESIDIAMGTRPEVLADSVPLDYKVANTSERVLRFIQSTARRPRRSGANHGVGEK